MLPVTQRVLTKTAALMMAGVEGLLKAISFTAQRKRWGMDGD